MNKRWPDTNAGEYPSQQYPVFWKGLKPSRDERVRESRGGEVGSEVPSNRNCLAGQPWRFTG